MLAWKNKGEPHSQCSSPKNSVIKGIYVKYVCAAPVLCNTLFRGKFQEPFENP